MQSTHFLDFWRPRLAEDGYDAIFKKKGNDLYIGGNVAAIDGCATFFKRSRFQLVKKYEVGWAPMFGLALTPLDSPPHRHMKLCSDEGRASVASTDLLGSTPVTVRLPHEWH